MKEKLLDRISRLMKQVDHDNFEGTPSPGEDGKITLGSKKSKMSAGDITDHAQSFVANEIRLGPDLHSHVNHENSLDVREPTDKGDFYDETSNKLRFEALAKKGRPVKILQIQHEKNDKGEDVCTGKLSRYLKKEGKK
jgi:hypothetical protein